MQYEYLVAPIVDVSNEPATVVADIKDHANANLVGIPPASFDIREMLPIGCGVPGDFVPRRERGCPFRMLLAGFSNSLSAYDPHSKSSQFAKYTSSHFGKTPALNGPLWLDASHTACFKLFKSSNSQD